MFFVLVDSPLPPEVWLADVRRSSLEIGGSDRLKGQVETVGSCARAKISRRSNLPWLDGAVRSA